MRFSNVLELLAIVTVVAGYQLQSGSPAFQAVGRKGACISTSSNADGAHVVIHDCDTEDTTKHNWDFSKIPGQNTGPQQIRIFGDKCLDVTDGVNADGTKLQIWTCTRPGDTNQAWIALSDSTYQWAGTNRCVDLTNGILTDGSQLQIWTCGGNNPNQKWNANPSVAIGPPLGGH
ncbi:hypothetical protein L218DRAFT_360238 [Marasmius fiardii PR-910]|nr:hypothetical protein L218DRAFT_360238 [Marasmius fiardii PR-910]